MKRGTFEGQFWCIFCTKLGLLFCSQCVKTPPSPGPKNTRLFHGLNYPHIARKYLFFGVFAIICFVLYNSITKDGKPDGFISSFVSLFEK